MDVLETARIFPDREITYKEFFTINGVYNENVEYSAPRRGYYLYGMYKDNFFKLFNKDNKDNKDNEDNENVLVSSLLHIEVSRLTNGLNEERIINIFDDNDDNCNDKKMIVKKVEVYDSNKKLIEIGRYSNRLIDGGGKVSAKKEINGKLRCIYKIPGSRKEHIKYKGKLITVAEYKKIMKA
jgi:hypothetical protein